MAYNWTERPDEPHGPSASFTNETGIRSAAVPSSTTIGGSIADASYLPCPGTTKPAADAGCSTRASTTSIDSAGRYHDPGRSPRMALRPGDRQYDPCTKDAALTDIHGKSSTPKRRWFTGHSRCSLRSSARRSTASGVNDDLYGSYAYVELLPYRREPALQPQAGRLRPREALRRLLPRADLRRKTAPAAAPGNSPTASRTSTCSTA